MMKKRDLFAEMMQGVSEMAAHRQGKITLRTTEVEEKPASDVSAKELECEVRVTKISEAEFSNFITSMNQDTRAWTMRAARGECGWICSDCCMSDQNGMPDKCFCGDERCTTIIQRDKQTAMREGNENV